ncbi:MAG TPA: nuclear transport factor 2 family protein, partial [Kofleriaceae bacterium]|nr:nuclear transport factor 2 family protein [Kofleriaceae bacterium]
TEGVQKDTGSAGASMKAPEEKPLTGADLAKKYQTCIGLINDNKLDAFKKDCVDAGYKGHDNGMDMPPGTDALIEQFTGMRKAMPDYKLTPQLIVVSGRNILAVELISGTHTGELAMGDGPAIPASNKKVGMLFFHRLAINDQNKAAEEWAFSDSTTMMAQLGLAPKDAPPKRPAMEKGWDNAPVVVVTADDAKEKANLDAFKKSMDAVNSHKTADLMALLTDDAVESDTTDAADRKGKKDIEAGMKMFFGAFSDAKVTADNTWAAGDYVIATGKFDGTNDHDLGKIKKTGKKVSLDYAEVALIKDGKVAQLWRFHDGMQFAMQLGLMPPPGAAPATGSAAAPAGTTTPAPAGSAAPATK